MSTGSTPSTTTLPSTILMSTTTSLRNTQEWEVNTKVDTPINSQKYTMNQALNEHRSTPFCTRNAEDAGTHCRTRLEIIWAEEPKSSLRKILKSHCGRNTVESRCERPMHHDRDIDHPCRCAAFCRSSTVSEHSKLERTCRCIAYDFVLNLEHHDRFSHHLQQHHW